MNIFFRNIISLLAAVAFFILPPKKAWSFGQKESKGKGPPKIEEISDIRKDTPLFLIHANNLFGNDDNLFAGHRSHSSHRAHSSHSSHASHRSSSSSPATPDETPEKASSGSEKTPVVPEKKSITPDRTPQKTPAGEGKHPTSAETFFNLGHSASRSGNYSEAINFYQKSLSLSPNNEQVHNNLGTVYYKSGQEAKAIENLQRAIAINPRFADPYYNLGAIYHNKGMNQEAKERFKQACDLGAEEACQILRDQYVGK